MLDETSAGSLPESSSQTSPVSQNSSPDAARHGAEHNGHGRHAKIRGTSKKKVPSTGFRHWLSTVRRPAVMTIKENPVARWLTNILYVVLFLLLNCFSLLLLQWGINPKRSFLSFYVFSPYFFTRVIAPAQGHMMLLNLILLMIISIGLILLTNHFWAGSTVFFSIIMIYSVANRIKMEARNEPILVTDLAVTAGNTGEIASFIPTGAGRLIAAAIVTVILAILLALVCTWYFGPGHILNIKNTPVRIVAQILLACVPFVPFTAYAATVGDVASPAHAINMVFGDSTMLFDVQNDANFNGTLVDFLRGFYVKVIDKPANYSKKTMQAVEKRYTKAAGQINAQRAQKPTDSNVILILSESFSDPTRVPGIHISGGDPMPFIRSLKNQTTSGLMLSSGYGGGTANLEFEATTGLSTADFSPSLKSPYEQFVPRWKNPTSFNQLWNVPGSSSVAFHAADGRLYLRHSNYKNFKFSHFWTLDGPEYVKYKGTIENNPLVSDADSYKNVTEYLRTHQNKTHFVQMETIQNHMPYPGYYYKTIPFVSTSTLGASGDELGNVNTYSHGMNYTDKATQTFLANLDKLDKPVTVIWYGDHLPGIYPNEIGDPQYALTMHETDYFIWSNKASHRQGTRIADAQYSSPNFFVAQAFDHMNSKVTPYLALLTRLHSQVLAVQSPLETVLGTDWNKALAGQPVYLDAAGKRIRNLTASQKQLLDDYKLVTYDLTQGQRYLQKAGFTTRYPQADTASKPANTPDSGTKK